MKKGQMCEGIVEKVKFPNKGIVKVEDSEVTVKNTIPGQKVSFVINKKRKGKAEGRLLEILEKSELENAEANCPHYGVCGGCNYQTLPYEEQLKLKAGQVLELMKELARDGMTMVVVTHEMGFAREVATRVIFMESGEVREQGSPEEFFGNPKDERLKEFLSKIL